MPKFKEIVVFDTEYHATDGSHPTPICLVARNIATGQESRLWAYDGLRPALPPFPIGDDTLLVTWYGPAEWGYHLAMGWPFPKWTVDLYAEYRRRFNGTLEKGESSLLYALSKLGLPGIEAAEKAERRALAIRGGPFTDAERVELVDYCASDVVATEAIFRALAPTIDFPRALLRGTYTQSIARMEWLGVPIDTDLLSRLLARWSEIETTLVRRIDAAYGVYEIDSAGEAHFRIERFKRYLAQHGIPWPRLESGALDLEEDTFKDMARTYPQLMSLHELRYTLSQLKLHKLTVGPDGRNRCMLSPFASKSGRNQPSNAKFVFGPATWIRSLIAPPPGWGLAYCDWSAQEFGIAAYLSGDPGMIRLYETDPYLGFAKLVAFAPEGATKESHREVRDLFKVVMLSMLYGAQAKLLAARLGCSTPQAEEVLRQKRMRFPRFCAWSEAAVNTAMLNRVITTSYGWSRHTVRKDRANSLANHLVQGNGADMLRIACVLAHERGVEIIAPIHDAVMIQAPLDQLEEQTARMRQAMSDASAAVLGGPRLRTDAKLVLYPSRYSDPRGAKVCATVMEILTELEGRG